MNASALENFSVNISNGWIISCSILTFGIITCAYLKSISNIHIKRKYKLDLQQQQKSMNSSETTKIECNKSKSLLLDDEDDYLDDDAWLVKKKEFLEKKQYISYYNQGKLYDT